MKKFIFIYILIFFVFSLYAEKQYTSTSAKAKKLYESAMELLKQNNTAKAIKKLELSIKADSVFIEAYLTLADVYNAIDSIEKEVYYYKKGLSIDSSFFKNGFYYLGEALYKLGLYEDAISNFNIFLNFEDVREFDKVSAFEYVNSCEFAIGSIKNPVPFNPVNLGNLINSEYDEYSPSITADGKSLFYTVLVPVKNEDVNKKQVFQEDFYVSNNIEGKWQKAESLNSLNTLGNEGTQTISGDGRMMFFTGCNRPDGYGSCDIYFSIYSDNKWTKPRNIGRPINSGAWESQPSISPDGRTLYFVSNRLGGKGKMDLWASTLTDDGYWGNPYNLGDSINTVEDDAFPFIHADNKTLYFASKGRIGMGGFDLYFSKKKANNTWTYPINMGYPINTLKDDKGLIINAKGDKAYFSSNRIPKNGDDLFEFELYAEARPTPASYVKGHVFDAYTKISLAAKIDLLELKTSNLIMQSYSHLPDGEFLVCLPIQNNYALNVSKTGYLFYSENFSLDTVSNYINPFEIDIPLYPILPGEKIILKNVFFETNSYQLKEESKTELDILVTFMINNPDLKAEITGHTDNIGSDSDNIVLSDKRAKEVYNYLINHSIDPKRLKSSGKGELEPISDNNTPEGRAANRRTEFKITGK